MENRSSSPPRRHLWHILILPVAVGLVACDQGVENKQVNQPLRPMVSYNGPLLHKPSGLTFPAKISGWTRSSVTAEQARRPELKMYYKSPIVELGDGKREIEQTLTVEVFPKGEKSAGSVLKREVAKVHQERPGGQEKPLKHQIGTSVLVTYFNPASGWHLGREICVVEHQGFMIVYKVVGTKGQFDDGYSHVQSFTGVIHGVKK